MTLQSLTYVFCCGTGDFGGVREEETFVLSELIDNLREEQQQQHQQLQQQMQQQGVRWPILATSIV